MTIYAHALAAARRTGEADIVGWVDIARDDWDTLHPSRHDVAPLVKADPGDPDEIAEQINDLMGDGLGWEPFDDEHYSVWCPPEGHWFPDDSGWEYSYSVIFRRLHLTDDPFDVRPYLPEWRSMSDYPTTPQEDHVDPDAALERIRECLREYREAQDRDDAEAVREVLACLADATEGLDEWLSKGGFPPREWRAIRALSRDETEQITERIGRATFHASPEHFRTRLDWEDLYSPAQGVWKGVGAAATNEYLRALGYRATVPDAPVRDSEG